jgi:tRNA-modifying protein YgfZ
MTRPTFERQALASRAIFSVEGDEAVGFLNNLVTCDLGALETEQAAYGALLTPQGKVLFDFFALRTVEGFLIDCALSQRMEFLQKLGMYKLRAKVSIAARDELEVGAMPDDDPLPLAYADPRISSMGFRMIAPKGTLPHGGGYDEWRISQGLADSDADIGVGKLFPHEANLDHLHGVSFTKGCYVGQEVVSRMEHRSTARSRIVTIAYHGAAPPSGTLLMSGDKNIGMALSSAGSAGLAMVRLDRLQESSEPVTANGAKADVQIADWLKAEQLQAGST